jgi:RNA polymerase sigma factor (sigma-70 family)
LKTLVEIAFERHDNWIGIVKSFGGLRDTEIEDLVQQMYLQLLQNAKKGIDFSYGESDINYYYIFKILRGLHVDLIRKKMKVSLTSLDNVQIEEDIMVNYEEAYNRVKNALDEMYWYDRKVYDLISDGESISELSRKSQISYYSLYNTYKKVVEKLKKLI